MERGQGIVGPVADCDQDCKSALRKGKLMPLSTPQVSTARQDQDYLWEDRASKCSYSEKTSG